MAFLYSFATQYAAKIAPIVHFAELMNAGEFQYDAELPQCLSEFG